MYTGWIASFLSGLGMPSFVFLFGSILDSFDSYTNTKEETLKQIKLLSGIFTAIGVFVWISTYMYYSSLLVFSERITMKTKVRYLEAILKQESAWFDLSNP